MTVLRVVDYDGCIGSPAQDTGSFGGVFRQEELIARGKACGGHAVRAKPGDRGLAR